MDGRGARVSTSLSRPEQRSAGEHIRHDLSFLYDYSSSYHQIANPDTWLHGLLEGGPVADRACIEDDNVGIGALLQSAFLSRCGG